MRMVPSFLFPAVLMASIANMVVGLCVYEQDRCQCAEMRSGGSTCLRVESGIPLLGSGSSPLCTVTGCADGMRCDCSGFEICKISPCPTYVARAGANLVIGKNVECDVVQDKKDVSALGSATKGNAIGSCVKPLSSPWEATVKTADAAKSASEKASEYKSEAAEIEAYVAVTAFIMASYSSEATKALAAVDPSGDEYAKVRDLVVGIESEAVVSVEDGKTAEGHLKNITENAATSAKAYERSVSIESDRNGMKEQIARLVKERSEIDPEEDSGGVKVINDRIQHLVSMLDYDHDMSREHRHEAVKNTRDARETIVISRQLYTSSVERRRYGVQTMEAFHKLREAVKT